MGGRSIACLNARDRNLLGFRPRPAHRGGLRRRPVPLRLRRRPARRRTHERADRAHHARRGPPRMRLGLASSRSDALRRRHRIAAVPAWKQAADFLFVQVGFSLDDLLAWRAEVDVELRPSTRASSSWPVLPWRRTLTIPGVTVPPDLSAAWSAIATPASTSPASWWRRIRDSGAFDGVHLIPVARYREDAARLEQCSDRRSLPSSRRRHTDRHAEIAVATASSARRPPRAASRRPDRPARRQGVPLPRLRHRDTRHGRRLGGQHTGRRVLPHEAALRRAHPGDAAVRNTAGCGLPYCSSSAE